MVFTWDPVKAANNRKKHGVAFEEAQEVFADPLHLSILDDRFSYFEERWITVGQSARRRLLVVANLYFTDGGEEVVRIISAREATKNEQGQYEGR
jgi:hypothetical protein